MNYQKGWEMLKIMASGETLRQMEGIENLFDEKKPEPKINFDPAKFAGNIGQMIEELTKFSIEDLKAIARQNTIPVSKIKSKGKKEAAEILAQALCAQK